jgi:hypothetical protein
MRVIASMVTAAISGARRVLRRRGERRQFMPLAMEPMATTPGIADQIVPRPPNRLVPAMTTCDGHRGRSLHLRIG